MTFLVKTPPLLNHCMSGPNKPCCLWWNPVVGSFLHNPWVNIVSDKANDDKNSLYPIISKAYNKYTIGSLLCCLSRRFREIDDSKNEPSLIKVLHLITFVIALIKVRQPESRLVSSPCSANTSSSSTAVTRLLPPPPL